MGEEGFSDSESAPQDPCSIHKHRNPRDLRLHPAWSELGPGVWKRPGHLALRRAWSLWATDLTDSMLYLHVWLHVVHEMRALFIQKRRAMLHQWHLLGVADWRGIA